MGIFSSLKRLLFASESVAKSAADKSMDYVKEQAIEIKEKAKDRANKDLSIRTQAENFYNTIAEWCSKKTQ